MTNEIIIWELKLSIIKEADNQKTLKEQDEKLAKQKEILAELK